MCDQQAKVVRGRERSRASEETDILEIVLSGSFDLDVVLYCLRELL
jgi:hypothetical protein